MVKALIAHVLDRGRMEYVTPGFSPQAHDHKITGLKENGPDQKQIVQ
jgi:hypothetical protein